MAIYAAINTIGLLLVAVAVLLQSGSCSIDRLICLGVVAYDPVTGRCFNRWAKSELPQLSGFENA